MNLLSVFVPWLSFFIRGKVFHGITCLLLQITIIGWLPAAIWAIFDLHNWKGDKQVAVNIANSSN